MQRQSLGSPGSSPPSSSASSSSSRPPYPDSDDGSKPRRKPGHRGIGTSSDAASTIHLIPALTLFCFLVLYLLSHNPSPTDMEAAFGRPVGEATTVGGGGAGSTGSRGATTELSGHRGLKEADRQLLLPSSRTAGASGGVRTSRKLRGGGGGHRR